MLAFKSNHIKKPESDLDLNGSRVLVSCGLGFDWSCGPQLASVRDVTWVVGRGNFRNELISALAVVVNSMPCSLVPFKYLMTLFAASICPLEGLRVYFARRLVIVAMSGRVEIESQFRQPTNCCMVWLLARLVAFDSDFGGGGMESTGDPILCGVRGIFI